MTIDSSFLPGSEIRPSDEGVSNPVELARIRQSIAGLPAVEVLGIENPTGRHVALPRARFAGWLNDREILVLENGTLAAFDIISGSRRTSPIKAANESLVFLR